MSDLAAGLQQYWAYELDLMRTLPEQVRSRQPESIHDLRAAGRRLRSTTRTFGPLIRRRLARDLQESLAWYNDVLGQARDAEVIADELSELLADHLDAQELLEHLEAERARTAQIADNMLTSARVDEVLALVEELVTGPWQTSRRGDARPPTDDDAPPPTDDKVLRRVRWAEKRVAREWSRGPLGDESTDQWLHRLRRRSKSARYAAEAVTSTTPGAEPVARAYDLVATLLGVMQDTAVIKQALAAWPDVLVADAIAAREKLAQQARTDLPEAIWRAVPAALMDRPAEAPSQ